MSAEEHNMSDAGTPTSSVHALASPTTTPIAPPSSLASAHDARSAVTEPSKDASDLRNNQPITDPEIISTPTSQVESISFQPSSYTYELTKMPFDEILQPVDIEPNYISNPLKTDAAISERKTIDVLHLRHPSQISLPKESREASMEQNAHFSQSQHVKNASAISVDNLKSESSMQKSSRDSSIAIRKQQKLHKDPSVLSQITPLSLSESMKFKSYSHTPLETTDDELDLIENVNILNYTPMSTTESFQSPPLVRALSIERSEALEEMINESLRTIYGSKIPSIYSPISSKVSSKVDPDRRRSFYNTHTSENVIDLTQLSSSLISKQTSTPQSRVSKSTMIPFVSKREPKLSQTDSDPTIKNDILIGSQLTNVLKDDNEYSNSSNQSIPRKESIDDYSTSQNVTSKMISKSNSVKPEKMFSISPLSTTEMTNSPLQMTRSDHLNFTKDISLMSDKSNITAHNRSLFRNTFSQTPEISSILQKETFTNLNTIKNESSESTRKANNTSNSKVKVMFLLKSDEVMPKNESLGSQLDTSTWREEILANENEEMQSDSITGQIDQIQPTFISQTSSHPFESEPLPREINKTFKVIPLTASNAQWDESSTLYSKVTYHPVNDSNSNRESLQTYTKDSIRLNRHGAKPKSRVKYKDEPSTITSENVPNVSKASTVNDQSTQTGYSTNLRESSYRTIEYEPLETTSMSVTRQETSVGTPMTQGETLDTQDNATHSDYAGAASNFIDLEKVSSKDSRLTIKIKNSTLLDGSSPDKNPNLDKAGNSTDSSSLSSDEVFYKIDETIYNQFQTIASHSFSASAARAKDKKIGTSANNDEQNARSLRNSDDRSLRNSEDISKPSRSSREITDLHKGSSGTSCGTSKNASETYLHYSKVSNSGVYSKSSNPCIKRLSKSEECLPRCADLNSSDETPPCFNLTRKESYESLPFCQTF